MLHTACVISLFTTLALAPHAQAQLVEHQFSPPDAHDVPCSRYDDASKDKAAKLLQQKADDFAAVKAKVDAELASPTTSPQPNAAEKEAPWKREWAGLYVAKYSLDNVSYISLAPTAGVYTESIDGCLGHDHTDWGTIAEVFPDGLRFNLAIAPDVPNYGILSERVYFVPWGERRFLVPEKLMLTLVSNYNRGGRDRAQMPLIPCQGAASEYFAPATMSGRPKLPAPYDALIFEKSTTFRVTKIIERGGIDTANSRPYSHIVTLDGGTNQGAFVGMELAYNGDLSWGLVHIDTVTAATCEGKVLLMRADDENEKHPLKPGYEFNLPGVLPDPPAAEQHKASTPPG